MCDRTGQDLIVINPAAKENTQSNLSLSLHTHMLTHRRSCSHPYACAQVYIICMCAHALTFYILLHSLRYTGSLNTHMSTQVTCTITHIQALVFIHCIFMCALAIHSNVHTYIHTYICAQSVLRMYAHNTGIGSGSGVQALSSCIHPKGFNHTPVDPIRVLG